MFPSAGVPILFQYQKKNEYEEPTYQLFVVENVFLDEVDNSLSAASPISVLAAEASKTAAKLP
jgi:hypothetical protein